MAEEDVEKNQNETPEEQAVEFASLNLQPGAKLQLFTHRGRTPVQHISSLIGVESNEYLLLRLPRVQGTVMTCYDGEKVTLRVFSGTMICNFDVSVIQTFYHPLNCLCVSYPRKLQVKKIRRELRIRVDMAAKLKRQASQDLAVRLANLSATGCQLRVDQDVGEVDDQFSLCFDLPLPGDEAPSNIAVNAKIRNIIDDNADAGSGYLVGLEFLEVDTTAQLMIRHYVYEGLLDRRQAIA